MSEVRLVLLGTAGGPTPKRRRAAPAQAIVVGDAVYLVDCGNAVAQQFVRAGLALEGLRAVFLSHHHSDHNADVGTLFLVAWSRLHAPVPLVGPPPLAQMIETFHQLNAYDIQIRTRDEGLPPLRPLIQVRETAAGGVIYEDERVRVTAARVHHPPVSPAFAFRFDTDARSIVISGDTAPCRSLIALARGADVLVHEVLYERGLRRILGAAPNRERLLEHLLASHTRVEDVGRIAAEAGARTLVLTHLIPGDLDDRTWRREARAGFNGAVVVGRDLLTV